MAEADAPQPSPVDVGPVTVGPVAHGGHCVARFEGRVIFVRHALPGEEVRVRLTDTSHERFWRGDAVEVLVASPDRVASRCLISGPGGCGGCDFQHVDLDAQRQLKAAVVAEQLERLAGVDWSGVVEPVVSPGTEEGLGWRTRMRYHTDESGRPGLRGHRESRVVPLPAQGCAIADPRTPAVTDRAWPVAADLVAAVADSGPALLVDGAPAEGSPELVERAAGRSWRVAADGFWQVHPAAADTFSAAVRDGLRPRAGERAFDLYCGVGLFSGMLADAGCEVWAVESERRALAMARSNLADHGHTVHLTAARVERALHRLPARADLVVLDPPRTGARAEVMRAVVARRPRAIGYVSCDPAALARDLATAAGLGYRVASLRAFDAFPMTHHVECVAVLVPVGRT